jgi:LacI family transcriptional regulator
VAVFGFDGLDESTVSQPILSTVVQPIADLGREAVRILLSLVGRTEEEPIQRYLPTRLVLRRSCGCGAASEQAA